MLPNIRLLKRLLFLCFLVSLFSFGITEKVNATHIRAGEILVMPDSSKNDPRCVIFKLITFTDFANTTADNPFATLHFGTGDSQEVERWRRTVARAADTYRSVYYFSYCFPAPGTYTVTYSEQNRQTNVVNIEDSQNQSFLLQTTITIDPFLGENHSPQMQVLPLDYGACGQIFVHNPGAYDADGDRLIFRLKTPQRNLPSGTVDLPRPGDVAGYRPLNDPSFGCPAVPNGGASTLTMDPNTGQMTWNAPCLEGDYNVAFVIEEYRNGRKIGEVLRDMQVRVRCTKNLRPTLVVPRDTCVIAGTTVRGVVRATDPDNDRIILEAYSKILPPATFNVTNNNSVGTFNWNTTCEDAELDTVQVTFKVTDIPRSSTEVPLTDIQPWRIRVVGPAPQNFKVIQVGRNMVLNWDSYTCKNATKIAIYRHEGPTNFVPSTCETGIPESAGFVRVGEVGVNDMTFTDNGGDTGLKRGVTYCYAIFAEFEGANQRVLPSIATLPICIEQETSSPIITNVSVEQTGVTNGTILVKWTQPRAGVQSLVQPLQYRLSRASGETPDVFTEVFRTNNLADTTFFDRNINTTANEATLRYIYKLEFYQNNGATAADLVEPAQTASSVQLKATARATTTTISLAWNYSVPWDNSKRQHYIYRKINNSFVLIDSVNATTTTGEYTDQGTFQNIPLRPGQLYCYYVLTNGTYNNPKLPDPLLNKSQEFCVLLRDSIPPCPPVLSINPLDCDSFVQNPTSPPYQNVLTWVPDQKPTCGQDIKYYTIYFRPQQEGEFDSIAFTNRDINTYIHSNLQSYAGCYVVTATDSSGNESAQSNVVCKDNCAFFQLPNIFTPNNDGKNDTFRPDPRSLFIRSIRFTVYNRWGDKVYESTDDPAINWRGVNNAGKEVSDGTYYYQAEVEFQTLSPQNAKKTYKGWVEIVR